MQRRVTHRYNSDKERYRAVQSCDAGADGCFVYAVITTGVYCKPSCRARLPLRRNIDYYPDPGAAENAGYRACKRCRPRAGARPSPLVQAAQRLLDDAPGPLHLDELSNRLHVSKFHLLRQFKKQLGLTPRQYSESLRLTKTREQLSRNMSVTEAVHEAGYSSGGRFYAHSRALGMTPSSIRRRGAGQTIRYTVRRTPLGQLLVATTERGVCAVSLGDDATELVEQLRRRFSSADFAGADARLRLYARAIAGWAGRERPVPTLPLDLLGTSFQLRVWKALQDIPPGTTVSYEELARRLGLPGGARAVGRACGDNPVLLLVPCHRVARKDGGLGGYRWGLTRKRALLDRERAASGSR